jgi:HEAT repeat protein
VLCLASLSILFFLVFHLFQAPIVNLLSSRQKDLRRDAAGALGNVAMSPPLIAKVVEAGALSPLVELAKSSVDEEVQKEVIRTLYILSYDEGTRRLIVNVAV